MSVRHILAEKGSHVEVIGSEATLEDAVQVLGLKITESTPEDSLILNSKIPPESFCTDPKIRF